MSAAETLGDGAFLRARILQPHDTLAYIGLRLDGRCQVRLSPGRELLDPRIDIKACSPEFAWGFDSAGAEQLAIALLAHATRDDGKALRLHQRFERHWVRCLSRNHGWKSTAGEVRAWALSLEELEALEGIG